jgi:hypothetical protein
MPPHDVKELPVITKLTLFRPKRTESKADTTTSVAQSIIASETSVREAKVERLRNARLEREASAAPAAASKAPRSRAAARGKS